MDMAVMGTEVMDMEVIMDTIITILMDHPSIDMTITEKDQHIAQIREGTILQVDETIQLLKLVDGM